jgi:2-phosphoglycerate kinase
MPADLPGPPDRAVACGLVPLLDHVFWIGGGSGAGKSTVARRLAAQHRLRVYATDAVMADHARRSDPERCPHLHAFLAMDMDERWVRRTPRKMYDTFPWFHGEGFDMIVDDLRELPSEPRVVAEGFRLLPQLVAPLAARSHAVWLLPTPAFRRAVFEERGPSWGFFSQTSDPDRALENLLARDAMFTDRVREDAAQLGLALIDVDGSTTEDELVATVAERFGV